MATIWDADVLIWAASQIVEADWFSIDLRAAPRCAARVDHAYGFLQKGEIIPTAVNAEE